MIENHDCKIMFRFILDHYNNKEHRGETPTDQIMDETFPFYPKIGDDHKESLRQLCVQIREKALERELAQLCIKTYDLLVTNPIDALDQARRSLIKIQRMSNTSRSVVFSDAVDDLIKEYDEDKKNPGVIGLPWPWDPLNAETRGIRQQDFTVIFARPKKMKSWLALKVAADAYKIHKKRVLIYSCEMPPHEVCERLACCLSDIDSRLYTKRMLAPAEEKRFKRELRSIKRMERKSKSISKPILVVASDKEGPASGGVQHLMAKAEEVEPDLIIVDSYYRMVNDRSGKRSMRWQDQSAIAQDLKHTTQSLDRPIIGVTQKNRTGGKDNKTEIEEDMEDLAFSDGSGQEADLVLRVKLAGEDNVKRGSILMQLAFAGARKLSINIYGFMLSVSPSTSWKWISWINQKGECFEDPDCKIQLVDSDYMIPEKVERKGKRKRSNKVESDIYDSMNHTDKG